jgi:Pectinacetylesterase
MLAAAPFANADAGDAVFRDGFEAAIAATANNWSWVPFNDAFCGDGSTVGIGINPSSTGSRVLIYLEGGGACYDETTCYALGTAANFSGGYSQAQFNAEAASTSYLALPGGFFDRTAPANPFKDYSYVYVPYCTGDVHSGNNVVTLGAHTAHFVGFNNMKAYLSRLYPTFRAADRVVLAGSSAGGFGALANWWQTQRAFGDIRVDMIDDSGTLMPEDILANGNDSDVTEFNVWNLATTLPPPCATCATALDTIFDFYSAQFPNSRGALLSYTQDTVLPSYYGISAADFTAGLNELVAGQFNATTNPNLAYFTFAGAGHVLWFQPGKTTDSTSVQQFITLMQSDSASWGSVH